MSEQNHRVGLLLRLAAAVLLTAEASSPPVAALPVGKVWAPIDTLRMPGHGAMAPQRFETDDAGAPFLLGSALGSRGETAIFRWRDTTWATTWRLGYGIGFSWPVIAPRGAHHYIWRDLQEVGPDAAHSYLAMSRLAGDSLVEPDTVALVWGGATEYSAAVSATRRWVSVHDQRRLRLFYSDTVRIWHEIPISADGSFGQTMAALDDTTATLIWADPGVGLLQGFLRGSSWTQGPLPFGGYPSRPRLLPQLTRGFWLAWGTRENADAIAAFDNGAWSAPESLRCGHRTSDPYYAYGPDLSRGNCKYPAVAWSAFNGRTGVETICVIAAADSGFLLADDIPSSEGGLLPVVACDMNGDTWLAWWRYFDGTFWTHTYTKATAGSPRVAGSGRHRALAWTLSEPAPESWWAVLRARGDGEFEPVARVRAGVASEMSWADGSPPAGHLRYRVRRESVDKRYEWLSEEASWPPRPIKKPRPGLFIASPVTSGGELEISGAEAGSLEVRVYDVQGRLVHRQVEVASGLGGDRFHLDLERASPQLPNGVYFVIARDARGSETTATKIVVLK